MKLEKLFHDYLYGEANKKGITVNDVDQDQLRAGIKIELEHTQYPQIAMKIALDHLAEIPDYYTRLIAMEKAYFDSIR